MWWTVLYAVVLTHVVALKWVTVPRLGKRHGRVSMIHSPAGIVATATADMATQLKQYTQSQDDKQLIIESAFLATAGLAFGLYEKRPRGSARDDLLEVRKSAVIANNLGVYAKSFIPKGTLVGTFPGYIRNFDGLVKHKRDDTALQSARRYIWNTQDGNILDPTNERGLVDLELRYMFGLVKVSTTLARINEPPPDCDVNCYVKVEGTVDVTMIAERDVLANEELFIDYGPSFDRSDYPEYQLTTAARAAEEQDQQRRRRLQPITMDGTTSASADVPLQAGNTDIPLLGAVKGGYLSRLNRGSARYEDSGILSPAEGSQMFTAMSQELLNKPEGTARSRPQESTKPQGERNKQARQSREGMTVDELLLSMGEEVRALGGDADEPLGSAESSKEASAGMNAKSPLLQSTAVQPQQRTPSLQPAPLNAVDASTENDSEAAKIKRAEQVATMAGKLDNMSDEQLEEVFCRLRASVMDTLQSEVQFRKAQRGDATRIGTATGTAGDAGAEEGGASDLKADLDVVLAEMAKDPFKVWQEIGQNPEKYLADEGENPGGTVD